ncbi:hypothetical protein [Breoghania sp. JC706]|uniref:hypothetical protein n=1 Tax=Breoghania sp. JC706 TaxID=3117732 RepID=UPI00300AB059
MTAPFTRSVLQAIEDFAAGLQIDHIVRSETGSVSFRLDRAGLMSFFPAQDGRRTLVSLKRTPRRPPRTEDLESFLGLAGWEPYLHAPINAGMTADGGFLLIASLSNDDVNRQSVEVCLDRLAALHDQAGPDDRAGRHEGFAMS